MADPECLPPLSLAEYLLGVMLFVGTIVAFLPQMFKIGLRRSHAGVSVVRFCLALTGTSASILYYTCLSSKQTFYCCTSPRQCFSNLLPVLQLYLIISCEVVLISLCMIHFDRKWLHEHNHDHHSEWKSAKTAVTLAVGSQIVMFTVWIIIALSAGFNTDAMNLFGTILIGVASIMVFLNIVPQIYWTFSNKSLGSLSLPTLFMQGTGSLLNALFYSFTNPWYIWLPPLFAGLLLIFLFFEGIYYLNLEKRRQRNQAIMFSSSIQDPDKKPLLDSNQSMQQQ